MAIRLHELHPSVVHFPLTLVPAAAVCDAIAVATGDRRIARLGEQLWLGGTSGLLLAGLAGAAASQEVAIKEPKARDMMFLHGIGNLAIATVAIGLTAWRRRNSPSVASAVLGLTGTLAAVYTAYLGGEMVYKHGVGVTGAHAPISMEDSPPLWSAQAPVKLVTDGGKGFAWLFSRLGKLLSRRQPLTEGTLRSVEPISIPIIPPAAEAPLPAGP